MAEDAEGRGEPRGSSEPAIPPAEEIRHADGRLTHPEIRYETSDLDFRWLLGILIGALVFGMIIQLAVWDFFSDYRASQAEVKKSPFPLAPAPTETLPPEPRLEQLDRLQEALAASAAAREATELSILDSYGPTPEDGYVHVPIDRAMKLVQKQLRSRPERQIEDKRENGLVDAGAPNSGRLYRGKLRWGKD
jgi:hypothetical protein